MERDTTYPTNHRFLDLTGRQFHRLTVLSYSHREGVRIYWRCRCVCGAEKEILGACLRTGTTKSCGCWNNEVRASRVRTHNKSGTPEWWAWTGMKKRCYDAGEPAYKDYGGRGITVCDRWMNSFEAFLEDMGLRPSSKHSLDRYPDNDGNYEPGNCRWATKREQSDNRRSTRLLTFRGRTQSAKRWSEELGIPHSCILHRINELNWTIEDTLTKPSRIKKRRPRETEATQP